MGEEKINFRGVNNGIYLVVEGKNFDKLLKILDNKVRESINFYRGAKLLGIKTDSLSNRQQLDIIYKLKYKYGFELDEEYLNSLIRDEEKYLEKFEEVDHEVYDESSTKFINGTIRSGQLIKHHGSIVIIGDVNPGAVIEARYNIIVLGSFRGIGYAGAGDKRSVVAAYKLNPTQLKIADKIARAPDEKNLEKNNEQLPEIARIVDDKVVIEPYLPNK